MTTQRQRQRRCCLPLSKGNGWAGNQAYRSQHRAAGCSIGRSNVGSTFPELTTSNSQGQGM